MWYNKGIVLDRGVDIMSKMIKVDSELLLFALKYATRNIDADKDKVIKNIAGNIDDLDNEELTRYIKVIESDETVETEASEYTWNDLKKYIEREIVVRESVKKVVDVFREKIN